MFDYTYNHSEPLIILSLHPRVRFKQTSLKGCYHGQNVTVLAFLERLQFKRFLVSPA